MVEPFLGTWVLESSENFQEYLKELGVPVTIRPLAASEKPRIRISAPGDKVSIRTETSFKNFEISFRLGEEFDEATADGRHVKSVVNLDGNSLVHVQRWLGKETTIRRQVVDKKMVAKHTMNNVVSRRVFKRV
uniref:Fatty acid binding protein 9 n=1 Tax=Pipistrellus kuhlii TaxID=59472 RepID=A0A7J7VM31_PIPKU|nr:fatty acid binding protein 9 [Pipistrellus kuhlii]